MRRTATLLGLLLVLGSGLPAARADGVGGYHAGGHLQPVNGFRHHRGHFRHHRGHFRHHHRPFRHYRRHFGHPRWDGYSSGYFRYHGRGSHFAFGLSLPLTVTPPPRVYYVEPPPVTVVTPPPASAEPDCLQTREFSTRIIIDGQEVDAYGTACLQPDGSWKQLGINLPR